MEKYSEILKLHDIFKENNIAHKFRNLFDGYQITVDTLKGTLSFVEHFGSYGHDEDTIEAWLLDSEEEPLPFLKTKDAYRYYTFCNIESKDLKTPTYPPKYCDKMNKYEKALNSISTTYIEDFEALQELVNKETPTEPIEKGEELFKYYKCPNCKSLIRYYGDYCPECGQKLDWSKAK